MTYKQSDFPGGNSNVQEIRDLSQHEIEAVSGGDALLLGTPSAVIVAVNMVLKEIILKEEAFAKEEKAA